MESAAEIDSATIILPAVKADPLDAIVDERVAVVMVDPRELWEDDGVIVETTIEEDPYGVVNLNAYSEAAVAEDEEEEEDLEGVDLNLVWEKYIEFEAFSYDQSETSLDEFITEWQAKMCTAMALGCQYSDTVLAFKLMEKANLPYEEITKILSLIKCTKATSNLLSQIMLKLRAPTEEPKSKRQRKPRGRRKKTQQIKTESILKLEEKPERDTLNTESNLPDHTLESMAVNSDQIEKEIDSSKLMADCNLVEISEGGTLVSSQEVVPKDTAVLESIEENEFVVVDDKGFVLDDGSAHFTSSFIKTCDDSDGGEDMKETLEFDEQPRPDPPKEIKENQCPVCYKFMSRKYDVKTHLLSHAKSKIFGCESCGTMFSTKGNLAKHRKKNKCETVLHRIFKLSNQNKRYSCEFCYKNFVRKGDLKVHRREHTGEKPYKCRVCDENFKTSAALFNHRKKHPETVYFTCKDCGLDYSTYEKYKNHRNRMHNDMNVDVQGDFNCDFCGMNFKNSLEFEVHSLQHDSNKEPYQCDVCGKAFSMKQRLKVHHMTHTNERPFKCPICPKGFCQSSALKVHFRTHSGEKPFNCDVCGKSFAIKKTLHVHQRVHTRERPYECGDCGKTFAHANVLKQHRRIHTGEKPYSCDFCLKSFAHLHHVKEHMKSHNKEQSIIVP